MICFLSTRLENTGIMVFWFLNHHFAGYGLGAYLLLLMRVVGPVGKAVDIRFYALLWKVIDADCERLLKCT